MKKKYAIHYFGHTKIVNGYKHNSKQKRVQVGHCGTEQWGWYYYGWGREQARKYYEEHTSKKFTMVKDWKKVTCQRCLKKRMSIMKTYRYKHGWYS